MLKPNIPTSQDIAEYKICECCGKRKLSQDFIRIKAWYSPKGRSSICAQCIEEYLVKNDFNWFHVDKVCQYLDIPFVPNEFEKIHKMNGDKVFEVYAQMFLKEEFEGLDWGAYFEEFKKLEETGQINSELPRIKDEERRELQYRWGFNYDDEALRYLEDLRKGLYLTQNVAGALQNDQAIKLCKISYEVDCRIREGADFDKLLASYDKLVKIAEFTPKNSKNANDFDSVGELIKWLEKKGFKSKFYDNVTRDVVDETIKNIQSYNQHLYTNESGIGDEITQRIESLKIAKELEESQGYYGVNKEYDLDEFENDGYEALMNDDFVVEMEDN